MNRNNWWKYDEAEEPTAQQAPTSDPTTGSGSNPPGPPGVEPAQPQLPGLGDMKGQEDQKPEEDDVEQDPSEPEDQDDEKKSYEQWHSEFMKMSRKSNTKEMLESIREWKDNTELEAPQAKFVNDNYQILNYQEDANINEAKKEIRTLVRKDIDMTNPGTTLMQHVTAVLEKIDPLKQVLIKLYAGFGIKADLHRKFIAAITGSVQVGGGGRNEDLIYADGEKDGYTINVSTRYATQFGEINLGRWNLKVNDAEKYLSEPELESLKDGAPELRQVLRRKIIVESIAANFVQRSILAHVNINDGTTYSIGWDFGESILAAYHDGKIVVRGHQADERNAMITDAGDIVSLIDIDLLYIKESGETDDYGRPETVEVPFIEIRNGNIHLVADADLLENASASMSGIFFRQLPFNGNPSDLKGIRDSLPNVKSILNKDY